MENSKITTHALRAKEGRMNPEQQRQENMEVARSEGYRAGRNGYAIGLNPFSPDDPLYLDWRQGWQQGIAAAVRAMQQLRSA